MCLVMPFLSTDLKKILSIGTRIEVPMAVGMFRQLMAAVEHMHGHYIMHCDIAPGNILIDTRTGICKLADFGLARPVDHNPFSMWNYNSLPDVGAVLKEQVSPDLLLLSQLNDGHIKAKPWLTHHAVTMWYRPPELLFGALFFDDKVDVWR